MSPRRNHLWAAAVVLAAGGLLFFVLGLFLYVNATTTPLHPNAQEVPSRPGAAPAPEWAAAVERARPLVRAAVAEQNLPGLSVAVGAGDALVWAEGFGWADLDTRVPVEPDTRFRIGTASKMLTAVSVGLLVEQGRMALDAPIQAYVPAYPAKPWPVTLRQLMAHTAGLRRDAGDEEPIHVRCERPADALPRFAEAPLLFEPGTQYRYSSYGWILVSAAVEAAAGESFGTFMRRQVFDPLGMADTRADAVVGTSAGQATYYFPRFAADPRYGPQDPDREDFSCFAGASAFVSTPSDLVRFGLAVLGGRLLQPATVQLLQASQVLPSGQPTGYGLGWDLEQVDLAGAPATTIGYDGALRDGTVVSFVSLPDRGLVVAVTANTSFAETQPVALRIAEAFLGGGTGQPRR